LTRSRFCSRHARVAALEHARHHELQPLDNLRFGRNAENGKTTWQRVQRRPLGRTQYDGPTHENRPTGSPTGTRSSSETRSSRSFIALRLSLAKTWMGGAVVFCVASLTGPPGASG